jgi:TonB family protein
MFVSFLVLAFGASAALPPPHRAQPRAPLASYVSQDDYPASAQSRGEQGRVTFGLDIGPDGRVTACNILGSSGSSALDNATCRIMRSRARFTPARDGDGRPVADAGRGSLSWSLAIRAVPEPVYIPAPAATAPAPSPAAIGIMVEPPRARASLTSYVSNDDYPASALARGEQGKVRFQLTVGVDGRVTNCRITGPSGSAALDNATCRIMRSRARFTPARSSTGQPLQAVIEDEIDWHRR